MIALSVIVPLYNEEYNIVALAERIVHFLPSQDAEIIFVDDGSTDNSLPLLEKIAAANAAVKVISLARNMGQTAAMQAGIDHASGDVLVFMDGDLQNDPADIARLCEKLEEGYDVVSGWRLHRQDDALKRNFPSRVANTLISRISGVKLHDYGCSLKAYRRSVIKPIRLYGEMHRFIPIYAAWQGAKIAEIPVQHHARQFGASKYGLERIFKVLLDICVIKFLDKYLTKPIYVFGGCGIVSCALACLAFLWAFGLKLFGGVSLIQTPLPLFGGIALLVSVMCILMGLSAEIMSRVYFESQHKPPYIIKKIINGTPGQSQAAAMPSGLKEAGE
jgi:glycosyltransferase involved in cell wall biosynthesis